MNSKIVSTKTTSAIFLAIVLVAGTIAAISPLFIIKGVNAQGDSYYVLDSHKDRKSYGTDIYKSQYSSYKQDYKPKYSSHGKDNSYKTKDNDILKKIKCNNNNININGENTGDINLGNDAQGAATEEGYWSASSFGSENGNEGYNNKKGFDCVTNNNDNIVQGGTGQLGPQGPPGISQLNNTNVYRVENSTTSDPLDPTNTFATGAALCDPGDFVINGGYNTIGSVIVSGDTRSTIIDQSLPFPLSPTDRTGWIVSIVANEVASEITLNINAVCFDNPPTRSP